MTKIEQIRLQAWRCKGLQQAAAARPIMSRSDYPHVPNNTSGQPTYRIADLGNPILQPWVRAQMERGEKHPHTHPPTSS